MKIKEFYSVLQRGEIVGVKKQIGFEVKIKEMLFNAYVGDDGTVHIIDPKNGIGVFKSAIWGDAAVPVEDTKRRIKAAAEGFEESRELEEWKKITERESYKCSVLAFKTFVRAQKYMDTQRSLAMEEYKRGLQSDVRS